MHGRHLYNPLFLCQQKAFPFWAVQGAVLTTEGAPNQRSQFLAVMCQQDSRAEIQTDTHSLSLFLYPLLHSQLLLDTLPIFLLIRPRLLFCTRLYKPSGRDLIAKRELAGGHIRRTDRSSLQVASNVTLRANTQINTDNWVRKWIGFMCCLLDKHSSVRHAG